MEYTAKYFDQYIDRRGTRCNKWDGCNEKFGVDESEVMLPMWVADMDFKSPQEVIEALVNRAKSGSYGYCTNPDSFFESIVKWVKDRYKWDIKKEWIQFTPGVIPGYTVAIQKYTKPGDGIIVQTPVYYPFLDSIRNNDRVVVKNSLKEHDDGYWVMNYQELELQVKDPQNKLMILSNPHNPVGRVWKPDELERVGTLCAENGVVLISDEIHADLMMKGFVHNPVANISRKIRENTLTCYSPSKTFNLAGLQTAYIIIPNNALREQFKFGITANRTYNMNWFGSIALETAYNECGNYADALCEYVNSNMDYMVNYIRHNLPILKVRKSEGTYMLWIDFRETNMTTQELEYFISHKAHIGVDYGSWFEDGGDGFLRFNLACPRSLINMALVQLTDALSTMQK